MYFSHMYIYGIWQMTLSRASYIKVLDKQHGGSGTASQFQSL